MTTTQTPITAVPQRRSVVLYLASGGLSIFGNALAAIVLPVIVLTKTGQIGAAALVAAVTAVPQLLAAIGGGVIADRFGRKRLSIVADLGSAASIAVLPLIELTVGLSLGWFIAAALLGALFDVPGMTAREALLPAVARAGKLPVARLSGINEGISGLGMLIGPALGGLLVAAVNPTTALWVTAITSALAALATALLPRGLDRVPTDPADQAVDAKPFGPRAALADLREGLRIVRREPTVLWLCGLTVGAFLVIGPVVALLLPAWFVAVGQPGLMGPVISAIALGGLIGAGVYTVLGTKISNRVTVTIGLVVMAVGLIGVMIFPPYPVLLVAAVLAGSGSGFFGPVFTTVLTERIPEQAYGRVLGLQNSGTLAAAPVGMALAGFIAEQWSVVAAGWALAVLWLIITVGSLASPWLRGINQGGINQGGINRTAEVEEAR
ncbi:MFS transporter [Microlunatus speluncae]|uniref:MFS transporter n=1 Tax=Microlunatus speluncae TaxID=2594267 RepID=UPI001375D58D|nr:MFS transporter [Microlunatus speluncae]